LGDDGPPIGTVLHPSPASPAANRGWARQAERQLRALGVRIPGAGGGLRKPRR
jgi:single-strand selective monofunctional uracil DNA glycosylase